MNNAAGPGLQRDGDVVREVAESIVRAQTLNGAIATWLIDQIREALTCLLEA